MGTQIHQDIVRDPLSTWEGGAVIAQDYRLDLQLAWPYLSLGERTRSDSPVVPSHQVPGEL